eukprot:scaffold15362_cov72-Phaeocystis_antarctica.AAC.8
MVGRLVVERQPGIPDGGTFRTWFTFVVDGESMAFFIDAEAPAGLADGKRFAIRFDAKAVSEHVRKHKGDAAARACEAAVLREDRALSLAATFRRAATLTQKKLRSSQQSQVIKLVRVSEEKATSEFGEKSVEVLAACGVSQNDVAKLMRLKDTAALTDKTRDKCSASKAAAVRVHAFVRPTAAGGVQLDLRPVLPKRSLYLVSKTRTNPVPKQRLVGLGHSISSVKERLEESWSSWWTSRRTPGTELAQSAPLLYRPSWTSMPTRTRASCSF